MKSILTVPEVAKICRVGSRTVERWICEGKIKSLPPIRTCGASRIERDVLIRYLKSIQAPLEMLEKLAMVKVLVVGADNGCGVCSILTHEFSNNDDICIKCATDTLSMGFLLGTFLPDCLVFDSTSIVMQGKDASSLAQILKEERFAGIERFVIIGATRHAFDSILSPATVFRQPVDFSTIDFSAIADSIRKLVEHRKQKTT